MPKACELIALAQEYHRLEKPLRGDPNSKAAAERRISAEAIHRRITAKTQAQVEDAWAWERQERMASALPVPPLQKPLSRNELDALPDSIAKFGLTSGLLELHNGQLFEVDAPS